MTWPADPRIAVTGHGCWRGLEANLTAARAGRYENRPQADHHLMIHVGPPARVTCREGAGARNYLQTLGDIDVIPAGAAPVFEDRDPTTSLSLWVSPSLLGTAADGMAGAENLRLAETSIQQRDDRLFGLGLLIKSEVEAERRADPLFVDSLAMALAARLLERYGRASPAKPGATLTKGRLRRVVEYIEANLGEAIRLEQLARVADLSPSHFRTLFRRTVRKPVHKFVIERRVLHARRLLEGGGVTIAQAALDSGFCHQSHLAKHMRQVLGVSPAQVARDRGPAS